MSYTPGFTPDARLQFRSLAFIYQELVLDELDRLALNPPADLESVEEVVLNEPGLRRYLFIHVATDHARRTVTVLGVGYVERRLT